MNANVVVVGLGPIGREMVRALVGRKSATIVGAADPAHAGADVGELAGVGRLGVAVAASAGEAYAAARTVYAVTKTPYAGAILRTAADDMGKRFGCKSRSAAAAAPAAPPKPAPSTPAPAPGNHNA